MDDVYILAYKKFIVNYLDSMPRKSRVTMRDLADHIHETFGFNRYDAYNMVRDIVSSRTDFEVHRGMGACKL